jgi:cyclophilin family peptidyl-prolyl cis-trans isomerase
VPSEKRARQRALRAEKQAIIQKQRKRRSTMRRGVIFGLVAAGIVLIIVLIQVNGGSKKAATTTTTTSSTSTTTTSTFPVPSTTPLTTTAVAPVCAPKGTTKRIVLFTKAPPDCIGKASVWDATFETSVGSFAVKMEASQSYLAVNNFVFLAQWNYFNGTFFHRIITGFVIQGGDPAGTGTGIPTGSSQTKPFPGYSFTGNEPPKSCTAKSDCYATGDVVLANSGGPTTDGSQFFVILPGGASQLSPSYTLFGEVTSGMAVVEKIGTYGIPSSGETGTPRVKVYLLKVTLKEVKA